MPLQADDQLVVATWGLMVSTALLCIASFIPAFGELRRWRQHKAILIPTVSSIRGGAERIRDNLLGMEMDGPPWPASDLAALHESLTTIVEQAYALQDSSGLNLKQRVCAHVLSAQADRTALYLDPLTGRNLGRLSRVFRGATPSPDDLQDEAIIACEAIVQACDDMESSLETFFKRKAQRPFSQEIQLRGHDSLQRAERIVEGLRRTRASDAPQADTSADG
ncbi:MAG: hypothetical protein GEU93_21940 [Propionibacteriales bacterium]|nr:hypothetical protein [Propionibacteriales bacterium]